MRERCSEMQSDAMPGPLQRREGKRERNGEVRKENVTTVKIVRLCVRERERNAVRCNMMRCHSRRRVYMQYEVLAGIECVHTQCYALHCVVSSTQT